MAKVNLYEYSDPRGYGALIDQNHATNRIVQTQQAITSIYKDAEAYSSFSQEDADNFGVEESLRLYPNEPEEVQLQQAQVFARKAYERFQREGASKKRAVMEAIGNGALGNHLNAEIQPDQVDALRQGRPYRRTKDQAWYTYLMSLDKDEDKDRFLKLYGAENDPARLETLTDEDLEFISGAYEQLDQLAAEDVYGTPDKNFPWWSDTMDLAMRPFNAGIGMLAGMYQAAREIAPADYEEQTVARRVHQEVNELEGWQKVAAQGALKAAKNVTPLGFGHIMPKALAAAESGEFAGVDVGDLLSRMWDKPELIGDIFNRGTDYAVRTFQEGIQGNPSRMLSYQWEQAHRQLQDQATTQAFAELGPDAKDEDLIVRAEQLEKEFLVGHAGSYLIEHPYISEFLLTLPVPTGWGKVIGATRKSYPLVKDLARQNLRMITESGPVQRSAERLERFMTDYPLIAERAHAAATGSDPLTDALAAVKAPSKNVEAFAEKHPMMARALFSSVKKGQDVAESTAATKEGIAEWWSRSFRHMGWVKRMGDSEPVQKLRRLVIAADQMAAGEVDIMRAEINKLVKTTASVKGATEKAHLFYLLDEPWAMAQTQDDISRVYGMVIGDVLDNRGRAGSTAELVKRSINKVKSGRLEDDALKKALDGVTDEQVNRIADIVDNPWDHVAVPEHLREAFDAGVKLRGIDQNLKELAGTMNVWRRVKKRKMGKRFDVPSVGQGTARYKVKKVIRQEKTRLEKGLDDLPASDEALELRDRWILTRGRFRDHWVPHAKWEKGGEQVSPAILRPVHQNMKHASALRRKMNLDDSIQRGLIVDPARQFNAHFQSALGKYEKGAQLKAIDEVMQGEGFAVRWDSRDIDESMNAAVKYTDNANKFKSRWEEAQVVIRDLDLKADKIRKAVADTRDFGGSVKKQKTTLTKRVRRLAAKIQKNEKDQAKLIGRQRELDDEMAEVMDVIRRGPEADYDAYTTALQMKYGLQDEAHSITTQLRSLRRAHVKRTRLVTQLEIGDPSLISKTGRASRTAPTRKEAYAAEMGRMKTQAWAAKHSPEKLQQKAAALEQAAIAKRIEARQLLANHEAYRIAGESAAANTALRVNVERVAESTKARLLEETGLEWVDMRDVTDPVYKEYLRVVGTPGKTFDSTTTLIPKHYAAYLRDLMPWIGGGEGPVSQAVGAYETFMRQAVRPFQKTWRTLVTVPRLLYTAKNFTSSVGLGVTALGARSLNPELQAVAMAASALSASDAPRAAAMAKGMLVHLKNETRTLEEVLDVAKKLGITSQLEARIGADVITEPGKAFSLEWLPRAATSATEFGPIAAGFEKVGMERAASVTRHLSPAYWARATENYQHLVAFMGGLDDLSKDGIARAFEFHNKWAGNYKLLGPAEKGIIKDAFGFYGWARFIVPHIGRMVLDRPEVLANWVKMRGGWERYHGRFTPVSFEYLPRHLRGMALGAPEETQPHTAGLDPDVAWYAAASMETPDMLSLSYAPFLEAIAGIATRDFSRVGKAPWELLGPGMRLMTELITLEDENGRRLPPLFDPSDMDTLQDSLLVQTFMSGVGQAAAPWMNLYRLYDGRPEDKPYRLALTVGRQMLGIDNHVARLFGFEPRSIGGMLDPATGGIPGVSYHLIEHRREIANKLSRSLGGASDYIQRQKTQIKRGIH